VNILIIGKLPEETAGRILSSFPQEWTVTIAALQDAAAFLPEAEVIIPEHVKIGADIIAAAPKLRMIQTGVGYDNVDLAACRERGIAVCNSAGVNADAVAEHTLAFLLAWYKNIPYLSAHLKAGRDAEDVHYLGGEIYGKTIGLLGAGAIASRVAKICNAFGMKVLCCSRSGKQLPGCESVGFEELISRSDIVSLHVPATAETRHIINAETLGKMKSNALLVNTARGSLVDESALAGALGAGTIAGACLDVNEVEPLPADSPLRELDNVILTPHTAGLPDGPKFHGKRYAFFAENIKRLEKGEALLSRVCP